MSGFPQAEIMAQSLHPQDEQHFRDSVECVTFSEGRPTESDLWNENEGSNSQHEKLSTLTVNIDPKNNINSAKTLPACSELILDAVMNMDLSSRKESRHITPREAWSEVTQPGTIHEGECLCDMATEALNISNLPSEIFHEILSYFTKEELCRHVAPVCSRWREFAYDPIHWLELKFSHDQTNLSLLLLRSPLLKKLTFVGDHHLESHLIGSQCPNLEELNISFNLDFDELSLAGFLQHCSALRKINLEGNKPVTKCSIETLCQMTSLTSVNLSHCQFLEDDEVHLLSRSLPKLAEFNIDGISWISDRTVCELVRSHKETLTSLTLDGAELTDDSLQAIGECPQLRTLHISFCELLTDVSLQSIKTLKTLRSLTLKKGFTLTGYGFQTLFSDGQLSKLRELSLNECINFKDKEVAVMANCCGRSLRYLDLSWCWDITDEGLEAIIMHCRNIRELYLVGQKQIKGQCFEDLRDKMPFLRELGLQQCNEIDDRLMERTVGKMPSLHVLDYYGQDVRESLDDSVHQGLSSNGSSCPAYNHMKI